MLFEFTEENLQKVKKNFLNYPQGQEKSSIIFVLNLAQKQNGGWLSKESLEYVAHLLSLPILKIYEIASFYSMFNLQKIAKYHVQICTNIVCMLRGSDNILNICKSCCKNSSDFTLSEVECLGACVNAPVVQINDDYYENLDEEKTRNLFSKLKNAKLLKNN